MLLMDDDARLLGLFQVDALYQRDIARMGGTTDTSNDDYQKFAAEMGFTDGPASNSHSSRHHSGLGYEGGSEQR